jgi:hypothetical protein
VQGADEAGWIARGRLPEMPGASTSTATMSAIAGRRNDRVED